MAKPIAPVSFSVARTFTVLITGVVWAAILGVLGPIFGGMLADPSISARSLRVALAVAVPLVPFFTAQGVISGMLDGYQQGRFTPPAAAARTPAVPSRNPWIVGIFLLLVIGAPCAALTVAYSYRVLGEGGTLTQTAFALWFVAGGAVAAVLAAWVSSGTPVVRELRAYDAGLRYPGRAWGYVLKRHVLPQTTVNLIINAWVALALISSRHMIADAQLVIGDAVIATWIIGLSTVFGARNHARTDARGGLLADEGGAPLIARGVQALLALAGGAVAGLVAWGLFASLSRDSLGASEFILFKASIAGIAAFTAARAGARAGLREGTLTRVVR